MSRPRPDFDRAAGAAVRATILARAGTSLACATNRFAHTAPAVPAPPGTVGATEGPDGDTDVSVRIDSNAPVFTADIDVDVAGP